LDQDEEGPGPGEYIPIISAKNGLGGIITKKYVGGETIPEEIDFQTIEGE